MGARWGNRAGALPAFALCSLAALAAPVGVAASEHPGAHVLYFEKLELLSATAAGERKAGTGEIRNVSFDAYGRRFELSLEHNGRLAGALAQTKPGIASDLRLYKGTVNDAAGSWARLATRGTDIHGMLWDGADLYVIEPAHAVANLVLEKTHAEGNLIFRLADTLIEPGALSCGTSASATSIEGAEKGAAAYESLLHELKGSPVLMQAAGANLRLELSALGDSLFQQSHGSEQQARDAMLIRLNNVDGIFSTQVGVEIQVTLLEVMDAQSDSLSDTTSASKLLGELGQLRRRTPSLRSRGLTHLFTGRDLEGSTVGIAYVDSLCRAESGAGLTESTGRGSWLEALIAAHEIGHNFGAVHDGEAPCAATPSVFLMAPGVSAARATFSQCSLNSMLPRVHGASCITALPPADIAIPSDLGTTQHTVARSFEWALQVANVGGVTATGVRAEILVPPSMTVDEAWVSGGSCTSGAGVIACEMGEIAGGTTRQVHLTLYGATAGSNSIAARVSAHNDSHAWNNEGDGTLILVSESEPATAPAANASPARRGGGGGIGAALLLGLAGLAGMKKKKTAARHAAAAAP